MAGLSTGAPVVQVYHAKSTILPDVSRVLACLYEKDVKFKTQYFASYGSLLKLQASSHAPVPFYDGPTFLEESREICRYIAETYEHHGYPFLLGKDALERASVEQWLHNEEHAFNPPSRALFCHLAFPLDKEDNGDHIDMHTRKLEEVLEVYEQRLSDSEFLAGNKFTLADLVHLPNSHYITASDKFLYLYDSRKNVRRWWDAISTRDSWQKVLRDMKRLEEENKQEELKKQEEGQQQKADSRTSGHKIQIYTRRQTSTEPRTRFVPSGTVSSSPIVPQVEKPIPTDTFLDDALVSSSQNSTDHKTLVAQNKETSFFITRQGNPSDSVENAPTTPKTSIPAQSTITPAVSPTTPEKPPMVDATKFSTTDASSPEPTETDLPTRHKPSSSTDVKHNLRVFDYYKTSYTEDSTPYNEPTPQKTSETLDTFSVSSTATGHPKTRPILAKEDPNQPSASDLYKNDSTATGVDSQDKEQAPYVERTPQNTTAASKPHTTNVHHKLQAEHWQSAIAGLSNLKEDSDELMLTPQEKRSKDMQQYPPQDSERATSHPAPQEPISTELVQGQEKTTQRPFTDRRRDEQTGDSQVIAEEEKALSDLPPSTQENPATRPSKKAAATDGHSTTPSQAAATDGATSPVQKRHANIKDTIGQSGDVAFKPKKMTQEDQDILEETKSGPPSLLRQPSDARQAATTPRDGLHVAPPSQTRYPSLTPSNTRYPVAEDTSRQPREISWTPRQKAAEDDNDSYEESKTADEIDSTMQPLNARGAPITPRRKEIEDSPRENKSFQKRYPYVEDMEVADTAAAPRKIAPDGGQDSFDETKQAYLTQHAKPMYIQRPAPLPSRQEEVEDTQDKGRQSRVTSPEPQKMVSKDAQDGERKTGTQGKQSLDRLPIPRSRPAAAKGARGETGETVQSPDILETKKKYRVTFEETEGPGSTLPRAQTRYPRVIPSDSRYPIAKNTSKEPRKISSTPNLKAAQDDNGTSEESKTPDEIESTMQPLNARGAPIAPRRQEVKDSPRENTSFQKRDPYVEDMQVLDSASAPWKIGPDGGKDRFEETKQAYSTPNEKRMYIQRPPPSSRQEVEDIQEKGRQSRETSPEPQKMVARDAQDGERKTGTPGEQSLDRQAIKAPKAQPTDSQGSIKMEKTPSLHMKKRVAQDSQEEAHIIPAGEKGNGPTPKHQQSSDGPSTIDQWRSTSVPLPDVTTSSGEQPSDHQKEIRPSEHAASEDARSATGDTIQSPHVLDTTKKSRGTFEEIKDPDSTTPKAKSLDTQDAQHTNRGSTMPTADQRKDVPMKPQENVQNAFQESKSLERKDENGDEASMTEEKSFSTERLKQMIKESESTIPKAQPTPSDQEPDHAAQPLSPVEPVKEDSNNARASDYTHRARPPAPRKRGFPDPDTQGVTRKTKERTLDNRPTDDSGKSVVPSQDQVSNASRAIAGQDMTPAQGALDSPTSDTQLASKKDHQVTRDDHTDESMMPFLSSAKQGDNFGPPFQPGAVDHAEKKFTPSAHSTEQPLSTEPWKEQTVVPTAEQINVLPAIIGQQDTVDTREVPTSKDAVNTKPNHGDVHPTSSTEPARRQFSVQGAEPTSSAQGPPPHVVRESLLTGDVPADGLGNAQSIKPSASPDAQHGVTTGNTPADPTELPSAQDYVHSTQLPTFAEQRNEEVGKKELLQPTTTEQEATESAAGPTPTLKPQIGGTLSTEVSHAHQKSTPSNQESAGAARPVSPDEPVKEDSNVPTAGYTSEPQKKFRQQARPPAPSKRGFPDPDTQGVTKKKQEQTLDNRSTDDSGKSIVPSQEQVPHALQGIPGQDMTPAHSALDSPTSDTQLTSKEDHKVTHDDRAGESMMPILSQASDAPSIIDQWRSASVPLPDAATNSGEQPSDHRKEIRPSQQEAAEDARSAIGDTIQSPHIFNTTMKSKGTFEEMKDPDSTIPKTKSLGAQDAQHTNRGSKMPTADQREDVSTKPQSNVQDMFQQSKSSERKYEEDVQEDEATMTAEKPFSTERLKEMIKESESTVPKAQPTDSQGPSKVEDTPTVHKDRPLAAQESEEHAQITPAYEKADSSTPKNQQPFDVPYTADEKLSASTPTKAVMPDDHTVEEPYTKNTAAGQKVPPPVSRKEPPSQAQPPTDPLQRTAPGGNLPDKSLSIDQRRPASVPSYGVSSSSGDSDMGMSSADHKLLPMSQEATLGSQSVNRAKQSGETPLVSGSSQNVHPELSQSTSTEQETAASAAGPTLTPQIGGTLSAEVAHAQQKYTPSDQESARAAQTFSPVEPIKEDSNIPAADDTHQARPPAPHKRGFPDSDTQGFTRKNQEQTLDSRPTDDSGKSIVPSQEQVSHASQEIPGEDRTPAQGTLDSPTSDTQLAPKKDHEVTHDDLTDESMMPFLSSAKQGENIGPPFEPDAVGRAAKKGDLTAVDQANDSQRTRDRLDIVHAPLMSPSSDTQHPSGILHEDIPADDLREAKPIFQEMKPISPVPALDTQNGSATDEVALDSQKHMPPGQIFIPSTQPTATTEPRNKEVRDSAPLSQLLPSTEKRKEDDIVAAPDQAKDLQKTFGQQDKLSAPGISVYPSSDTQRPLEKVREDAPADDLGEAKSSKPQPVVREVRPPTVAPALAPATQHDSAQDEVVLDGQKSVPSGQDSAQSVQPSFSSEVTKEDIAGTAVDQTEDQQTRIHQQDIVPAPYEAKTPLHGTQDVSKKLLQSTLGDSRINDSLPSQYEAEVTDPYSTNVDEKTPISPSSEANIPDSGSDLTPTSSDVHASGEQPDETFPEHGAQTHPPSAHDVSLGASSKGPPVDVASSPDNRHGAPLLQDQATAVEHKMVVSDQESARASKSSSSTEPRRAESYAGTADQANVPQTVLGNKATKSTSNAREALWKDQESSRDGDHTSNSANPHIGRQKQASLAGRASEGPISETHSAFVDNKMTLPSSQAQNSNTGSDATLISGDSHLSIADVPAPRSLQNKVSQPPARTQAPTIQALQGSTPSQNVQTDSLEKIEKPRQGSKDQVMAPVTGSATPSDVPQGTSSVQPRHEASFELSSTEKNTMIQGNQIKALPDDDILTSQIAGQSEHVVPKGNSSQNNLEGTSKESLEPSEEPEGHQQADQAIVQSLGGNRKHVEQTKARDTIGTGEAEEREPPESTSEKNSRISQEEALGRSDKKVSGVQLLGENTKGPSNSSEDAPGDIQTSFNKSEDSLRSSEESKVQLQPEGKTEGGGAEAPISETEQPKASVLPEKSYQNNSSQSQTEASDKSWQQSSPGVQNKNKDSSRLDGPTDAAKSADMEDNSQ